MNTTKTETNSKMNEELNKLKEYASRSLRKEFYNTDNIAAAIDCIELADELGLNDLYKEMLDDFLSVDENKAFWKRYMKWRQKEIDANL